MTLAETHESLTSFVFTSDAIIAKMKTIAAEAEKCLDGMCRLSYISSKVDPDIQPFYK